MSLKPSFVALGLSTQVTGFLKVLACSTSSVRPIKICCRSYLLD